MRGFWGWAIAIWWRRETEERQAVSERAILWRVVRPRTEGVDIDEGGEGRRMRDWDWCITTTMKNTNATQNQSPHTVDGVSYWVLDEWIAWRIWLTLNYSETHVEGSFGDGNDSDEKPEVV